MKKIIVTESQLKRVLDRMINESITDIDDTDVQSDNENDESDIEPQDNV